MSKSTQQPVRVYLIPLDGFKLDVYKDTGAKNFYNSISVDVAVAV